MATPEVDYSFSPVLAFCAVSDFRQKSSNTGKEWKESRKMVNQ